jgi:hypothetical protein
MRFEPVTFRIQASSLSDQLGYVKHSSVRKVIGQGWTAGFRLTTSMGFFSYSLHLGRFCDPVTLLYNLYWGLFTKGQSGWRLKLTIHLHQVRMWFIFTTPKQIYCETCKPVGIEETFPSSRVRKLLLYKVHLESLKLRISEHFPTMFTLKFYPSRNVIKVM